MFALFRLVRRVTIPKALQLQPSGIPSDAFLLDCLALDYNNRLPLLSTPLPSVRALGTCFDFGGVRSWWGAVLEILVGDRDRDCFDRSYFDLSLFWLGSLLLCYRS